MDRLVRPGRSDGNDLAMERASVFLALLMLAGCNTPETRFLAVNPRPPEAEIASYKWHDPFRMKKRGQEPILDRESSWSLAPIRRRVLIFDTSRPHMATRNNDTHGTRPDRLARLRIRCSRSGEARQTANPVLNRSPRPERAGSGVGFLSDKFRRGGV